MAAVKYQVAGAPSLAAIVEAASTVTEIDVADLIGKHKWKELKLARAAIAMIAHGYGYSSRRIGIALNRDGSTVRHAILCRFPAAMEIAERMLDLIDDGRLLVCDIAPSYEAYRRRDRKDRICCRPRKTEKTKVLPFPPGADRLIMYGFSRKVMRNWWPEWRI